MSHSASTSESVPSGESDSSGDPNQSAISVTHNSATTAETFEVPDRKNELALLRTDLVNERTLLAYVRTALMIAGTGGTLIKFFGESRDLLIAGFGLVGAGGVILAFGIVRFRVSAKRIAA